MAQRGPLARLLLALLALTMALPGAARAGGEVSLVQVNGLSVEARTPWPSAATKGYQPLRLVVDNPGEQPADLEVIVKGGWGNEGLRMTSGLSLGPRERREVELMVPAYLWDSREFRLELRSGSDRTYSSGLGSTSALAAYTHLVAVFSDDGAAAGRATELGAELTPTGSTSSWSSGRWRNLGLHLDKDWNANVGVVAGQVPFADMSRRWEAYTSLDLALVDVESGLPAGPELSALLAWARMGGVVVLAGDDLNRKLAGVEALREWMEERFELERLPGLADVRRYQCGFGRLVLVSTRGLLASDSLTGVLEAELRQRVRSDWTPSPRGSRGTGESLRPRIPGLGALPYRAFVAFMILFAILVGPVNFIWARRRGRPAVLLFTIPALALGGALLALGYGFFGQGISTRTQSDTTALLDQRSGLVQNAEVRALYAGLAPGRGLVPGQGTGVFPWGVDLMNRRETAYEIRHAEETSLRAGFLPSRVQVRQAILTSRGSRLRLGVSTTDGACRVENGLGVDLDELVVHGFDGRWYQLDGLLEAGTEAQLVALAEQPDLLAAPGVRSFHPEALPDLPLGTYSARTRHSAFRDDCGVELSEVGGTHTVLGVLAREAGR